MKNEGRGLREPVQKKNKIEDMDKRQNHFRKEKLQVYQNSKYKSKNWKFPASAIRAG